MHTADTIFAALSVLAAVAVLAYYVFLFIEAGSARDDFSAQVARQIINSAAMSGRMQLIALAQSLVICAITYAIGLKYTALVSTGSTVLLLVLLNVCIYLRASGKRELA